MKLKHSQVPSSKRRSEAQGAPRPETVNRLKSERVQLELEAHPPEGRVRKIAQRDAGGRFVQPLVLPAAQPPFQVAVALEVPGAGEVVVSASWLPAGSEPAEGGEVVLKEVARAAA